MSLESKLYILKDRALMFHKARAFLSSLQLIEVDTPILSSTAPIDAHIDIIHTKMHDHREGYFHSSPEYAMKRLLALGLEDIYQISHVFRYGEEGRLHNPEFTMVEWYKSGCSFNKIIDDTAQFIKLFLSNLPLVSMSYREMLNTFTGIDYVTCSNETLVDFIKKNMEGFPLDLISWDRDTLLQYIVSFAIEPLLGKNELFVLKYFPATQAALSQVKQLDDESVAERFEIYYQGIELANGYHELVDPKEQRKRLALSNQKRICLGKSSLPIDEHFLCALEKGIPDSCGVAVGFDRLMMLRHKKDHISDVIPFSWSEV
jgi:lysyl-tRNA synthetase class 2